MNIFALDNDPTIAATYHHDTHVRKMLLEGYQILSTVIWIKDMVFAETAFNQGKLYWPTHMYNRVTRWSYASYENFRWLKSLVHALSNEYTFRNAEGRIHKSTRRCFDTITLWEESAPEDDNICWEENELLPFIRIMPSGYIVEGEDPVISYRRFYRQRKKYDKRGRNLATWTRRGEPFWWKDYESYYVEEGE